MRMGARRKPRYGDNGSTRSMASIWWRMPWWMTACGVILIFLVVRALSWMPGSLHTALRGPVPTTTKAAVVMDGRTPLQRDLPDVYPNGDANRFRCDLPSLRYQCDLDGEHGCRAYPQLFPAQDVLRHWSPNTLSQPSQSFSSICRFNVSSPYELALAMVFHDMEVPFIVYGIPALTAAAKTWTDEYISEQLGGREVFKVHISNSSHFMFFTRHLATGGEAAPYESQRWTYSEFVERIKAVADAVTSANAIGSEATPGSTDHQFFYFMIKAEDIRRRASFVTRDLAFLDGNQVVEETHTRAGAGFGNLFLRDPAHARDKGIRCRIGMPGIITEGHVDAGLNMIAMVRGHKRYLLSPPSVCKCLGLLSSGPSARHTVFDWAQLVANGDGATGNGDAESAVMRAAALQCPTTEVVVGQGDVLYVPSYWYHHIVALDNSIQCNARSGVIDRPDVRSFLAACGLTGF